MRDAVDAAGLDAERRKSFDPVLDVRARAADKAAEIEKSSADVASRTYGLTAHALGFAAGIARQAVDPVNLATLPLGGPLKGPVLGVLAREFGIGFGIQASQEPFIQPERRQLGIEAGFGQGFASALESGIGQAGFAGLIRAGAAVIGLAQRGRGRLDEGARSSRTVLDDERASATETPQGAAAENSAATARPAEPPLPESPIGSEGPFNDIGADDLESAPVITSDGGGATAAINYAENGTGAVTTVTATDADATAVITYSISGGADAAKFAIDANTGVLTFLTPPDFENPTDVGANNTYEVIVQASDGTNTDTQTITVTVTDIDDTAPTITSSNAVNVAENATLAHSLTANETVTWSIVGGADQARFELSGSTLRWLANGVKDFEAPDDTGLDNTYAVTVRATDLASNTTDQNITVTVTDVAEGGGTPANARLVSTGNFRIVSPGNYRKAA